MAKHRTNPTSTKPAPKIFIHETISYPRVQVTPETDSCNNPNLAYDHVLACGHGIQTITVYEPCAPNCHHIHTSKTQKKKKQQHDPTLPISDKPFYCDACIETANEALIPEHASSTQAEKLRTLLREKEALARNKATRFRRCYVGFKVSSVPVHSDGRLYARYVPRREHHPWDVALPQLGENAFEGMEVGGGVKRKREEMQGGVQGGGGGDEGGLALVKKRGKVVLRRSGRLAAKRG